MQLAAAARRASKDRLHFPRNGHHLEAGGTPENAQLLAAHESPRTTKLYDPRSASRCRLTTAQILAYTAIVDRASKIQLTLPAFPPLQDARNGGYPAFGTASLAVQRGNPG
jgi:hypothetical protein